MKIDFKDLDLFAHNNILDKGRNDFQFSSIHSVWPGGPGKSLVARNSCRERDFFWLTNNDVTCQIM